VTVYVHLPVLVAVVSLVYSATRHDRRDKILREAAHWAVRMTTFLLSIGLVLFALSTFL
jgi:uncharacterized membrane protein YidH (DUF202 family)